MIQIGKTIISEELIDEDFVCNLSSCKGICCVEGDAGAPIEEDERSILDRIFPQVKPYMSSEGINAVLQQGTSVLGEDKEWETPLIDGGACAYVIENKNGTILCAIEQAFREGKIDWKKPISCHLYPIRLKNYTSFTAVNYNRWSICKDACSLGKELKVPVYQFVKEALIRKFGQNWFSALEREALSRGNH